MGKIYVLIFGFFLILNQSTAQTATWNGSVSNDYNDPANWTPNRNSPAASDILSFNALAPIDILHVPNVTIGGITIASGTSTVSLTGAYPTNVLKLGNAIPLVYTTAGSILCANFLTINLINPAAFTMTQGTFGIATNSGGKIIINSALTLNGAAAKLDFDVAGTLGTTITGSITATLGIFNSVNATAITWTATANYYHNYNGVSATAIPASTWAYGSTCNITGMNGGLIAPTGLSGINFANFTWNCSAQAGIVDLNLPLTTVTIIGSLSILNTNNRYLRLAGAAGGNITAGAYTQSGPSVVMLQSSTGTTNLTVNGTFLHDGGILDGVGNGASNGIANLNLKGNVTKKSVSWISSSTSASAQMNIEFSGSAAQNVSIIGSGWWSPAGAGRSNFIISNTVGVTLTAGSVLVVYNGSGPGTPATCTVSGILAPQNATAVVSYIGACTLLYTGTTFQTATAAEFPTLANTPTNLTINNSLGVSLPLGFSRTIPGTLTMLGGNMAIGTGNTLSLTNTTLSTQLIYTSGYISTGTLSRYFPTSSLPISATTDARFPFGSGVNDRSLYVFFSATTSATDGMISVAHFPVVGVTGISITEPGPPSITLDKRTNTNWTISRGTFDIGAATISLLAVGGNIGSVDQYLQLRLTNGTTPYGTLINPNTGSNSVPVTGKSGLGNADITGKTLYIGSDGTTAPIPYNPLTIITFNWTGMGADDNWTNPFNWTGVNAVGYPSASTEIAIIDNTATGPKMPTINSSDNINVFQLTVSGGKTLTMLGSAIINVYDAVSISGPTATSFAPSSTFSYASSNSPQSVLDIPYGTLTLSGTAAKTFPSTITITGSYGYTGTTPNVITNSNTFRYNGAGAQNIAAGNYYNLTITGSRGGGMVTLGPSTSATVTIGIANVFDVSGLSSYTPDPALSPISFTTVNFSSAASQYIPGFRYALISNSGNGPRVLDSLGSTDPTHVIYSRAFIRGNGAYTIAASKVNIYVSGAVNPILYQLANQHFNDLEFSGNQNNLRVDFDKGEIYIAGKFSFSIVNYQQVMKTPNDAYFVFDGAGDQTITAFKTNVSPNTPAFKYPNLVVFGGNRNVTLGGAGTDTIGITGTFQVPRASVYSAPVYGFPVGTPIPVSVFSAGKGFKVAGSTVNFSSGSGLIPELLPSSAGTYNYDNISVTGGNRIIESNNMTMGGNLFIAGNDTNYIKFTSWANLKIGDAATSRTFNVLGNVSVAGITSSGQNTGQLDLNTGTLGSTNMYVSKSLSVSPQGQISSTGESNGTIIFKGILPHTYTNTSSWKNGYVNFKVGDGITNSKLTLLTSLDLIRSTTPVANKGTLDVLPNDTLDCGLLNIVSNLNNGAAGDAIFNLQAGATLITANTGGVEGTATSVGTTGSILNDATMTKTYNPSANYVFNALSNTNTSFPSATTPFPMASLTLGNNVNAATFSLNKSIEVSNVLTLNNSSTLALVNSDLNLKSKPTTTARVAPVPPSANINYGGIGTGRFIVERYYPGTRSWRLITSPLSSNNTPTTIFSEWQNGGSNTPGIGAFVTGPNPNAGNGLDFSALNNYSLKTYKNNAYVNIDTTLKLLSNSNLTAANIGYFMFVRGDRSRSPDNTVVPNTNNTTLSSKGKLQYGPQTFPGITRTVVGTRYFILVGNPYASPINFDSLTRNNIAKRFIVWDPHNTPGFFVSIDDPDDDGIYTYSPAPIGGQDLNIQSSQAFFVETDTLMNVASSLTINESDKSTVNNLGMFRPLTPSTRTSSFRSNLLQVNGDNSTVMADGNIAEFNDIFKNTVDIQDALKITNLNETFGLLRNNTPIATERRKTITANDTLFLNLARTTQRNYRFQFEPTNMDPLVTAFLEDNYTGIKTPVSIISVSTFDFAINGDAKSAATNRFRIVFKSSEAGPLPVTYSSIKAYQKGDNIAVEWTVENEINISKYEVEKSTDG
ncbi:MAG: hypothetical protein ABI707_07725, partial [Ferruginibacter sp.]